MNGNNTLIRKKRHNVETVARPKSSVNREQWLTNLADALNPRIEKITGKATPSIGIAVGFPSQNALSVSKRRLGECWPHLLSNDGTHQIFISPLLGNQNIVGVAAVVAHELVHANVGTKEGHNRVFGAAVRPLGLKGRLTATVPGPEFIKLIDPILAKLGPYEHAGMKVNPNFRPAPTRMIKAECPAKECDFKVRITRTWLDNENYGAPICPCHNVQMIEEVPKPKKRK